MTYNNITRNRSKQLGKELNLLINGDITYSEKLPFPKAARQILYDKVFNLEKEWSNKTA